MVAPTTTSTILVPPPGSASLSSPDLLRPETWTSEAFRTFCRATFAATPSATSSPESQAGRSRSGSPDGPTTGPSGPAPARASLSARQAREAGLLTSGTYGRTSIGSSSSAALQSSLESRLRAALVSTGSTLFKLTWKDRATPLGRRICALRASALRTSDSGCGSWPTAGAKDGDKSVRTLEGAEKEAARKGWTNDLCTAALAAWPTASARDWKGATHERWGTNARPLNEVARLAGWATPMVTDLRRGTKPPRPWDTGVPLTLGPTSNGSPVETGKPGQLNVDFSLWLMGYGPAWSRAAQIAFNRLPSRKRTARPSSAGQGTP